MSDDELTRARSLTLDGMSKEAWEKLDTYTKNEVEGTDTFRSFQKVMTAWSKWGFRGESADESAARVTDALEELLWKEHVEKRLGLKTPTFEGRLTAAGGYSRWLSNRHKLIRPFRYRCTVQVLHHRDWV